MNIDEKLRDAKHQLSQLLLGKGGVCGVGIGKSAQGDDVLTVHLDASKAAPAVPETFQGYPVQQHHGEPFRKLATDEVG
jgi:hypothetical protein